MHIGVDIGGTFTDLVLSENGEIYTYKLPSTPGDPSLALLEGLAHFQEMGFETIDTISHGSTVATNAILERKGARTAFITTQGFKDLLFIGRQNRPGLYQLHPQLPPPLIPESRCFEIPERLNYQGVVQTPLDEEAVKEILEQIKNTDIASVAVCFLFSYLNPEHEVRLKSIFLDRGDLKDWQVSLSSEVLPEFREFERASTVVLEAYVRPVMSEYLTKIEKKIPQGSSLRIMNSDGGVMSASRARSQSIRTVLSGPAAGVIGGFQLAQEAGFDHVITLDMGGTSTDVSLCPGKQIHHTDSDIDGFPVRNRMINIATIGAGGGSIARVDLAGGLHVGPESAGADPGPIMYGFGGQQITVTDANAYLGRISPDYFLGGDMPLYPEQIKAPLTRLGERLGLSPEKAALGIIEIINANIERAIRKVSIGRGYDPREFTIIAFGGAGPLHVCEVAERLEIPRVIIPFQPGVLCAYGLLMADLILEDTSAVVRDLSTPTKQLLEDRFLEKEQSAITQLGSEGVAGKDIILNRLVDARYLGQSFELTIPYSEDLEDYFHNAHQERYGYSFPDRTVEIVNMRLQAIGKTSKPIRQPEPIRNTDSSIPLVGEKSALIGNQEPIKFSLYERKELHPGAVISGAAFVFQMDSTTYLPPHWEARVDRYRNLLLEYIQ